MSLWTISLVTQILCLALVTGFVALRGVVAWRLKKGVDVEDDIFNNGTQPPSTFTPSQTTIVYKLFYTLTIIYVPMTLLAKLTLLTILARLFILRRSQTLTVYLTITLTTIYYITIFFIKIFICDPVSTFWTSPNNPHNPNCLSEGAVFLADAVMSVITDLAILLLPIGLMFPLRLGVVKKVKVGAMLGCGGLAVGFSIYRLVLVVDVGVRGLGNSQVYARILLSGNAEGGFGLICSCIPALHILVSRVKAKMRKGSRSSAIASGDGSGSGSGGKKRDRGVSSSGGTTATPIVITSSPEDVLHDPGGLLASCDNGDGDDNVYDQNEEGEGRGEKNDNRDNREEGWV
ncbi:hypothetical protein BO83DRAFT_444343 [Aspergillus eucalypticola CBS 122712]|uniref:Rhodopsin domain-containing protein n=1 Tax=Aspergillus eucalypticola (strain CBS 122712 / IBT 29274) TaxID=1448314 RepID=A0A317VQ57_ASPEC|nr:uncharacterized protein BO83DRAFT_444343 [Aspergillus eucalypticola CBS 122712]PWY73990.1 hypothetical protein BO83DRAFT_444343 [Aspergillus eucalypticola CBS 122712]